MKKYEKEGTARFLALADILQDHNILKLNTGAEVGVRFGETSEHLFKTFPYLLLYLIDPYLEYKDINGNVMPQATVNEARDKALTRLLPYTNRTYWLVKTSVEAAKDVDDDSLDFVFIDAVHQYAYVMDDIRSWLPKVRPHGLICGHDYDMTGVGKAVRECFKPTQIKHVPFPADVWYVLL